MVDTAHGHSLNVLNRVRWVKRQFPSVQVIGGNIASAEAALALAEAGADAVKVGIGPGSICTTRVVTGVGLPQVSAIADVARALEGTDIPVIADGGVRFSGDIAKAIAAGAHCIMVGSMLAGTEEALGEIELYQGRLGDLHGKNRAGKAAISIPVGGRVMAPAAIADGHDRLVIAVGSEGRMPAFPLVELPQLRARQGPPDSQYSRRPVASARGILGRGRGRGVAPASAVARRQASLGAEKTGSRTLPGRAGAAPVGPQAGRKVFTLQTLPACNEPFDDRVEGGRLFAACGCGGQSR